MSGPLRRLRHCLLGDGTWCDRGGQTLNPIKGVIRESLVFGVGGLEGIAVEVLIGPYKAGLRCSPGRALGAQVGRCYALISTLVGSWDLTLTLLHSLLLYSPTSQRHISLRDSTVMEIPSSESRLDGPTIAGARTG